MGSAARRWPPAVWIATGQGLINSAVPPRSITHCLSRPILDGEAGCVVQDPRQDQTTIVLSDIWTKHDVGIEIQADTDRRAWAMRIFDSAIVTSAGGIASIAHPTAITDGPGIGALSPYTPHVTAPQASSSRTATKPDSANPAIAQRRIVEWCG